MQTKQNKPPKRGSIIQIIADRPAKGQDSIAGWIGKQFAVVSVDHDDGSVSVADSHGCYVIQPEEFEVIKP